jgi:cytochrome P450
LFEEAIEALGPIETKEDELKVPTFAQTKQMPFLDLVMKETLRLRPSVGQLPRKAAQEVDLGDGYIIPKGTPCTLNIHSIHHNLK